MCYINWRPDRWEWDYPPSPEPRPLPRLAWATPVDIVELCASLEAYSNQIRQSNTFRLCYRFGGGALSQLPQEILDHIISDALHMEKATVNSKWKNDFVCFQGRCTPGHHFATSASITEEIWETYFIEGLLSDEEDEPLNKDDFTPEKRAEMVRDAMDDASVYDGGYEGYVWDIHDDAQNAWVDRVCLCKKTASTSEKGPKLTQLNDLLKEHFGLEVTILHEVLSGDLRSFLPDMGGPSDCSYYTTCFLTLPPDVNDQVASHGRQAPHQNKGFMKANTHLAYHQTVDLSQLNIAANQKLRFARAMRILGIQPYYHLSELEALLTSTNQDEAFWSICDGQVQGCPKPTETPQYKKTISLHHYICAKSKELAKQSWPQLMIMATSDACDFQNSLVHKSREVMYTTQQVLR